MACGTGTVCTCFETSVPPTENTTTYQVLMTLTAANVQFHKLFHPQGMGREVVVVKVLVRFQNLNV